MRKRGSLCSGDALLPDLKNIQAIYRWPSIFTVPNATLIVTAGKNKFKKIKGSCKNSKCEKGDMEQVPN